MPACTATRATLPRLATTVACVVFAMQTSACLGALRRTQAPGPTPDEIAQAEAARKQERERVNKWGPDIAKYSSGASVTDYLPCGAEGVAWARAAENYGLDVSNSLDPRYDANNQAIFAENARSQRGQVDELRRALDACEARDREKQEAKRKSDEEDLARPLTEDCASENQKLQATCGHVWSDTSGRITCQYPTEFSSAWEQKVASCEAALAARARSRAEALHPKLARPVLSALLCIDRRLRKALLRMGGADTSEVDARIAAAREDLKARGLALISCTEATVVVKDCGSRITVDSSGRLGTCQRLRMYRADTLVDLLAYCLDENGASLDRRCKEPRMQQYVDVADLLRSTVFDAAAAVPRKP
jgi:hypothetical protein